MSVRWIDVSEPVSEGITVWPGDPGYTFEPMLRTAKGDSCNVSIVQMSCHTGTHVDAPWHFEAHGKKLDEVDAGVFFGRACIFDVGDADSIGAETLASLPASERIIFKTRNSALSLHGPFRSDYVGLTPAGARVLVERGVKLVGTDYLSIGPFEEAANAETHHILLRAGVFIVEGLRLSQANAGECEFVVLPLALAGADGAPGRAFVGLESD